MAQFPFHQVESDLASDSMYLHFSDRPIRRSVEMSPDIIIDLDEDDTVVGIDVQYVSAIIKETVASTRRGSRVREGLPSTSARLQLVGV